MKHSYEAETGGITQDELLVRTAFPPIVWHEKKRKTVEQHHSKGQQAKPHIEFSNMVPQIRISVYGSVFNASTHANEHQRKQRGEQQCIDGTPAYCGANDLKGIEEEGCLYE